MRTIKVFPDHLSSGLWESGISVDECYVKHAISTSMLIALKYWHWLWEVAVDLDDEWTFSKKAYGEWYEDGRLLVQAMNDCQNEFNFIYAV